MRDNFWGSGIDRPSVASVFEGFMNENTRAGISS